MILPSAEDVLVAHQRIASWVHRTPVVTHVSVDAAVGGRVYMKCENLQRTGSFKFRGACNAVAALPEDARRRGVCAHSSGNHAQALALAAQLHGVPAYVVMPEDASPMKVAATRSHGAQITFCQPTQRARIETAERIGRETGAQFVDPHDDPAVIAGQGTALLEMAPDAEHLDLILVPVGGGGLLSGTLLAAKIAAPNARVIGCEPANADDAARGLATGQRVVDFVPNTIADGLRTPLGEIPFEIIRASVDGIVTVSEEEIVQAVRFLWERAQLVIEPSSAVAVAPLLSGSVMAKAQRVGIILSGGNVNLDTFFRSTGAERP